MNGWLIDQLIDRLTDWIFFTEYQTHCVDIQEIDQSNNSPEGWFVYNGSIHKITWLCDWIVDWFTVRKCQVC